MKAKVKLREIVRDTVEEILDEAIRRDRYVERVHDLLAGILGEYLKASYARVNPVRKHGVLGTAAGWDREVEKLFRFNFATTAGKRLKGGSGQKGAFEEALDDLRFEVRHHLEHAREAVAEAFGLDAARMVDPPDAAVDEFFAMARNEFDALFEA